ncbi:MAG TPA: hypothetical protein VGI81_02445 [Tepidisphaeraceae bacterium]
MIALVLSLCVFVFLTVVGYAVLALLAKDEEPLYRLLLAPVTGASATILLLFIGNELGLPVERFGPALAAALVLGSGVVLWRAGRRVPAKDLWPFVLLSVLALFATGWPMLKFGLDWVSFCNDDMANYCLGAERLLRHGYFQAPDATALAGADYTQFMWLLHVLHRPGSELVLAMVSGITHVVSLRIFMPVVLAFMLCQIAAAGAMTYAAGRSRLASWVVVGLVAVSGLGAFGTLYQLIAQVIGLGIAAGLTSVLLRPVEETTRPARIRRGALIGLLLAGLIVTYTEVLPFVALAWLLYAALTVRGGWAAWRPLLIVLGIGAITVLALLNRYFPLSIIYLLQQVSGTKPENPATTMFPYYLMPSGPVYIWGLFALGQKFPSDQAFSTLIVVAILLTIAGGALVVRSLRRGHGPAFVCAVMALVFAWLFHKHIGFGLYKLAMYLQPFLLSAVVLGWFTVARSRIVQVVPLVLLGLGNLRSQHIYTLMSRGVGSGFAEIVSASSTHLLREYADLLKRNPSRPLETDTYNLVLAKFQMGESVGRPLILPSENFLANLSGERAIASLVGRQQATIGMADYLNYLSHFKTRTFDMHPAAGSGGPQSNSFFLSLVGRDGAADAEAAGHPLLFVGSTGRQSPFNRWHDPEEDGPNFRGGGLADFPNHLTFVASRLGEPYYVFGRENVGIYQLEGDTLLKGRTMAAVGRYLLFQVVNPSPAARLELDVTNSIIANGDDRLPPAEAIGAGRGAFPMVGRGSARIFSPPLTPQVIDGYPFVAIDMGTEGDFLNYAPGGLMKLWGREVRLDNRQLTGFLRDVSLVSEAEYQALRAPAIVERFPEDLGDRTLEYSGFYEDGFVGERAWVALTPPTGIRRLIVEGRIPRTNDPGFTTDAVLTVDGKELVRRTLGLDIFRLTAELAESASNVSRHRIELSFSRAQHLPDPDNRPIAAQVLRIGFAPGPSSVTWSGGDPARLGVEYSGIYPDGWAGADGSIRLDQPAGATRLVIRGMVPRIDDADFKTNVVVKVDGKEVARKTAGLGDFEIAADVPAGSAERKIELSFSKVQPLPAPEKRSVSALLRSVAFERPSEHRSDSK